MEILLKSKSPDYFLECFLEYLWLKPSNALWRSIESYKFCKVFQRIKTPPILDIGCGEGSFEEIVLENIDVAVDSSRIEIEGAKIKKKKGIIKEIILADAKNLPFKKEVFRTVVSNSVIEHIIEVDNVLSEVKRVLKNGGNTVITATTPDFNRQSIIVSLLRGLRLEKISSIYLTKRNNFFQHHTLIDSEEWINKFEKAKLKVQFWEYYCPKETIRVFEILNLVFSPDWLLGKNPFRDAINFLGQLIGKKRIIDMYKKLVKKYALYECGRKTGAGLILQAN